MKEFEKYYPGPYKFDDSCGWVICSPNDDSYIHAWDWEDSTYTNRYEETEWMRLILRKINGERVYIPRNYEFKVSDEDPVLIEMNGEPIICVRGWGMLCGSHKLPESEAIKIQDAFINFIIKQLYS